MKHSLKVTLILISFFVIAQLFGMFLVIKDANVYINGEGEFSVSFNETAIGERPQVSILSALFYILFGILIATVVLLLLIKKRMLKVWKGWYVLAVFLTCFVSLTALTSNVLFSVVISVILSLVKVYRFNFIIHNSTEILIYSGIAYLLAPMFNVLFASILLIMISVYDMISVWKSKHMISLAKFQASSNVFAGLMIPLDKKNEKDVFELKEDNEAVKGYDNKENKNKDDLGSAILGGGDIAFPLIFNSCVSIYLLNLGFLKSQAFLLSIIPIMASAVALLLLFLYSKKGRFYPAMPFLTVGCLSGFGMLSFVLLFV